MITIDFKVRKPIYEQLIDNVKELVVKGVLKRDDQLPSVRQLATNLAINPNTIQKAYTELERQGVIYSLKGRGSFVASNIIDLREQQVAELNQTLAKLLAELFHLGVSKEQIITVVETIYREEQTS